MPRVDSHKTETRSKDWLRSKINESDDALFRELSERDYGVDAVVELFFEKMPTGRIALLQIKSTETTIVPLKKEPFVVCKISTSNAYYALQHNLAVFITYISLKKPVCCYYANLYDSVKNIDREKLLNQKYITVRMPQDQCFTESAEAMINEIKAFYT
jgi:hypothetical protein